MPKTSPIRPASWAAHEAYWLRLAAPTCCPGHPLAPFWPNRALAPGGFDTGAVSARSRAGPRQLRRVRRGRRRPHLAPGLRHRHVQARPELDGAQPAGAARRDVRPRPPRNPFLTCSPYPPRVCRPRTGRHTHTTRASPCRYAAVDLDGDGRVDFADFAVTRRTHTQTHTHNHTHTHTHTPTLALALALALTHARARMHHARQQCEQHTLRMHHARHLRHLRHLRRQRRQRRASHARTQVMRVRKKLAVATPRSAAWATPRPGGGAGVTPGELAPTPHRDPSPSPNPDPSPSPSQSHSHSPHPDPDPSPDPNSTPNCSPH